MKIPCPSVLSLGIKIRSFPLPKIFSREMRRLILIELDVAFFSIKLLFNTKFTLLILRNLLIFTKYQTISFTAEKI